MALTALPYSHIHLLNRTGFGPTLPEIKALAGYSYPQAVDRLLNFDRTAAASDFALIKQLQAKNLPPEKWEQDELQQAWLQNMLQTRYPIQEKLTLFWHNHFTSALGKVEDPRLMVQQNQLLRTQALGNFRQLLHAISSNPAMLIYLDSVSNSKDDPNENYARELMELFTIGTGHYTEQDVRQAARAFSGWQLEDLAPEGSNIPQYRVYFDPEQHDDGPKTFMGHTGNFSPDDILEIILGRRETAYFIARKLWEFLAAPNPSPALVTNLGNGFYDNNYDITWLVRAILLQPEFLAPATLSALVKSPVELVVGSAHKLGFKQSVSDVMALLGQELFAPPNVRGWRGGRYWINSATFLNRCNFASQLLADEDRSRDPNGYLSTFLNAPGQPNQADLQELARLLLSDPWPDLGEAGQFLARPYQSEADNTQERQTEYQARRRGLVHLLMVHPHYQLV